MDISDRISTPIGMEKLSQGDSRDIGGRTYTFILRNKTKESWLLKSSYDNLKCPDDPPLRRGAVIDGKIFRSYHKQHPTFKEGQWFQSRHMASSSTTLAQSLALTKKNRFGTTRNLSAIATNLLQGAKRRAKKHGGRVTITRKWILERLRRGVCELTDEAFHFPAEKEMSNRAPSLDRIDSKNRDYSPENTRIVLIQVNTALGRWTIEESLPVLEAMVRAAKKKQAALKKSYLDSMPSMEVKSGPSVEPPRPVMSDIILS